MDYNEFINGLGAVFNPIFETEKQAQEKCAEAEKKYSELDGRYSELEKRYSELSQKYSELKQRHHRLEQQAWDTLELNEANDKLIAKLKAELDVQMENGRQKDSQIANLNGQIEPLQEQIKTLQGQVEYYKQVNEKWLAKFKGVNQLTPDQRAKGNEQVAQNSKELAKRIIGAIESYCYNGHATTDGKVDMQAICKAVGATESTVRKAVKDSCQPQRVHGYMSYWAWRDKGGRFCNTGK